MAGERVTTEQAQGWIEAYERTGNGNAVPARIAKDLLDARAQVVTLTAERDTAYAEMNAVHSLLSLLGITPTDHYLHAGVAGSLLPRVQALAAERDAVLADVRAASGECLVPCPEPGTDLARVLIANRLLARERDEARRERDTALTRIAALEAEVARLAPAPVEDTGDCRTCASHDTAGFCAKPTAFTRVWFNRHICDDDMTRRPGSPPCPGFARKET